MLVAACGSPSSRCRYVEAAAHLLITIRSLLIDLILRNGYVQVDETFTNSWIRIAQVGPTMPTCGLYAARQGGHLEFRFAQRRICMTSSRQRGPERTNRRCKDVSERVQAPPKSST